MPALPLIRRALGPPLAAGLIALVSACAMSQQQEVQLGATTAAQVSAQLPLIRGGSNPGAVDAFFASHPLEEDRITATEAQIATFPAAQLQRLRQDSPAFQTFRRRLLSLPPSPAAPKAGDGTTSRRRE